MDIHEKLRDRQKRYGELQKLIADPAVLQDIKRYRELAREYSNLTELVDTYDKLGKVENELENTHELIEKAVESDLRDLAHDELKILKAERDQLLKKATLLLIPKDPMDLKNIIMEIRAGTGGEEAALFVADLFRMYTYYSERQGWKIEIMSSNETGIGGFKEIIFSITGNNVFENFKYESGVHRVQRVPVTESGGRIHTSAVTVAVLPEAEETEVEILGEDIRIDVYRSSGPGGQSVNTTDSAVRLTHLPTGLVVTCQDEKSQHKNKAKAMRVLRARLYDLEESKQHDERAKERKNQIGSGDRSERIRTYNFPQNRVTDHRINLTLYKLNNVVEGELGDIIEALKLSSKETLIKLELQ